MGEVCNLDLGVLLRKHHDYEQQLAAMVLLHSNNSADDNDKVPFGLRTLIASR